MLLLIENQNTIVILGRNKRRRQEKTNKTRLVIKLLCETFGQLEWIFVLAQAPRVVVVILLFFGHYRAAIMAIFFSVIQNQLVKLIN